MIFRRAHFAGTTTAVGAGECSTPCSTYTIPAILASSLQGRIHCIMAKHVARVVRQVAVVYSIVRRGTTRIRGFSDAVHLSL